MLKFLNFLFFIFTFSSLLTACSYNQTSSEIESLFEPTWDFSKSSEVIFDDSFVEIKEGKAQLKPIDLERSGSDFDLGTHTGTQVSAERLQMRTSQFASHDISWTPKYNSIVGYWPEPSAQEALPNSGVLAGRIGPDLTSQSINSSGIEVVPGKVQNAMAFSGDGDDYFMATNVNMSLYALSVWFKFNENRTSLSPNNSVLLKSSQVWVKIGGAATIGCTNEIVSIANGTGNRSCWNDNSYEFDQSWHHLTISWNPSMTTYDIYIDGQAQTVTSAGVMSPISFTSENFRFHDDQGQSISMDELTIWNEPLLSSEVTEIYERQSADYAEETSLALDWAPKYNSIVGYWKMDGNWQDSSGNGNHGTPINNNGLNDNLPQITSDSQVGSQAGQFDDDIALQTVEIANSPELENTQESNFTLQAWYKPQSLPNNTVNRNFRHAIIVKQGFHMGLIYTNTGHFRFNWFNSSDVYLGVEAPEPYEVGIFYHLVAVANYDKNILQLYIDGDLKQERDISGESIREYSAELWRIGSGTTVLDDTTHSWYADGMIDDVAIWQEALTQSEVSQIYHHQKQGYASQFDSDVMDLGKESSPWPHLSWSTHLPFGKDLVGDFDNNGDPEAESSSTYSSLSGDLSQGLMAHWNFNKNTNDISASNYSGTLNGDVSFSEKSIFEGQSTYYDGTGDYIAVDSFFSGLQTFTYSFWVYPTNTLSGQRIFTNYRLATTSSKSGLQVRSDGKWGFFYSDDMSSFVNIDAEYPVAIGQWSHVVLSYDGSTFKFFVDGTERKQVVDNLTTDAGSEAEIGAFNQGTDHELRGYIDEGSIWNRALTSTEVQQLYRRGANRIKFQVKSCVDSLCECKSFSSSPQGTATDCDGDTIVNALDFDDSHKAEFMGPGGDGTTYYSEAFNRKNTHLNFNCGTNSSDSDGSVCVKDEITVNASPSPSRAVINYNDLPLSARPQDNPYFQYRVYMEADNNAACDGSPCFPELNSVQLSPNDIVRYYGSVQEVKPSQSISYKALNSIKVIADDCARFQLSPDGTTYYYWSAGSWSLASSHLQSTTKQDLENHILSYSNQFGSGNLFIKALLQSNASQSSNCSIQSIDIDFSL